LNRKAVVVDDVVAVDIVVVFFPFQASNNI